MRLLPQADMPEMECFLVYPEEMKNVARVQAFRDFLASKAQRWRYRDKASLTAILRQRKPNSRIMGPPCDLRGSATSQRSYPHI